MEHEKYMREALREAQRALERGDVPVGCVVAGPDGSIIGRGGNLRQTEKNAAAHAELRAIERACAALGDWRLSGCALYVTLEPCPMCAGAVINSRIPVVVYGAGNPQAGSCGSVINLFEENYGHRPAVYGGVLEDECIRLLSDFFDELRRDAEKK